MTTSAHGLAVKSVRDPVERDDGERILVDRLWPRGVSRQRAHLSDWMRDIAPSDALRRWFGHDPERWQEFRVRYQEELRAQGQTRTLRGLAQRASRHRVTLLFGASDREHNNAVALADMARHL